MFLQFSLLTSHFFGELYPYLFVIFSYITTHPTLHFLKSHLVYCDVCNVCFSVRYFTRNNLDMCIHRHPINLPVLKFFISVGRKGTLSKPLLKRILIYMPKGYILPHCTHLYINILLNSKIIREKTQTKQYYFIFSSTIFLL